MTVGDNQISAPPIVGDNRSRRAMYRPNLIERRRLLEGIVDRYRRDYAQSDIARAADVDPSTVSNYLDRAGITRRERRVSMPDHPVDVIKWRDVDCTVDLTTRDGKAHRIAELAPTGASSAQIADDLGVSRDHLREIVKEYDIEVPADRVMGKSRQRIDSNRIIRETCTSLEGLTIPLRLVNFAELDAEEIGHWTASLTNSIRALNRLNKRMKGAVQ